MKSKRWRPLGEGGVAAVCHYWFDLILALWKTGGQESGAASRCLVLKSAAVGVSVISLLFFPNTIASELDNVAKAQESHIGFSRHNGYRCPVCHLPDCHSIGSLEFETDSLTEAVSVTLAYPH
jgi:hypothetical protein